MPERPDCNKKSPVQISAHKSYIHHPVRDAFGAFFAISEFSSLFSNLIREEQMLLYLYDDYISAKTIFRSCHRSNQNILICVPLHARKNPLLHIPLPSTDFISDKHLIHARNSLPSGNDIFCLNLNPSTFPSLPSTHHLPFRL